MATRRSCTGTVASFDAVKGLGVVSADRGDYPFHCTAICDGSRTIDEGVVVSFDVVPGRAGRWEATRICPV
jgi:cold shock CspA family protein